MRLHFQKTLKMLYVLFEARSGEAMQQAVIDIAGRRAEPPCPSGIEGTLEAD